MRQLNTVRFLSMLAIAAVAMSARAEAQGLFTKPQLGILGGVTLPTGELEEDAATGWHAGGFFQIRLRGALDARLDGAYNKLGSKTFDFDSAVIDFDANVAFGSLSAVLNLGPDSAAYPGDNSISPYIMAGAGVYRVKSEGTCTGSACSQVNIEDFTTSKAGFNLGAGANVPLWGIPAFAEFRYHRFGTTFPGTRLDGTATMLTGSVGIKIR
jgi:opacity protein-like surface antigen